MSARQWFLVLAMWWAGNAGLVAAQQKTLAPVPPPTYEQKLAWMLRLEDQRIVRDPPPPVVAPPPARADR